MSGKRRCINLVDEETTRLTMKPNMEVIADAGHQLFPLGS
jgi:hypothetical protein